MEKARLDKIIAAGGRYSRREVRQLIRQGRVLVDGVPARAPEDKVDPESARDMTGAPSLVLRCLGRQESAWDLAKQYNTTIPAILAANELEDGDAIPRDQLLLIPRKRA